MSLKKLLERSRRRAGDALSDAAGVVTDAGDDFLEAAGRARNYLTEHANSIPDAAGAAVRVGSILPTPLQPVTETFSLATGNKPYWLEALTGAAEGIRHRDPMETLRGAGSFVAEPLSDLKDTTLPAQSAAAYGANRALGYEPMGGPLDRANIAALHARATGEDWTVPDGSYGPRIPEEPDGRRRLLARLADTGIDVLSDPATYAPTSAFTGAPKAARLAAEVASGMGGETLLGNLGRGAALAAVQAGVPEALRGLGMDKDKAELTSMVLAPLVAAPLLRGGTPAPGGAGGATGQGETWVSPGIDAAATKAGDRILSRLSGNGTSTLLTPEELATARGNAAVRNLTEPGGRIAVPAGMEGAAPDVAGTMPGGVMGAVATRGSTVTSPGRDILRKLGAPARGVERITNPSAVANQDVRRSVEGAAGLGDAWALRTTQQIAPEARALAATMQAGAVMDPGVRGPLLINARNAAARRGAGVVDEMNNLLGSARDILEHRGDYRLTPAADAAYRRLASLLDDQAQRERAAGMTGSGRALPHLIEPAADAATRGAALSGAAPVYRDYRSAILDGARSRTDDIGELFTARITEGMKSVADRGILSTLAGEAVQPGGSVIPEWQRTADNAGKYMRLRDVLGNTGTNAGEVLGREYVKAGGLLPATLNPAERAALVQRLDRGGVDWYVEKDTGRYLRNVLAAKRTDNPAAELWDQITSGQRAIRLGTDIAAVIMRGVGGAMQAAAANPVVGYRGPVAFGKALADSLVPGRHGALLRNPKLAAWAEAGLDGLRPESLGTYLDRPENRLWVERFWEDVAGAAGEKVAGKVGRAIAEGPVSLEKWQWGTFLPAMKFHTAEALYNTLRPMKAFAGMSDEELMRRTAARVNTVLSGFSRMRAGVSPNMEFVQRGALISPNWTRGQIANLTDVTKAGPEGMLARRFWVGMATAGLGTSVGLSLALTNDYSDDHLERLLNPEHPDSITNPRGRNFGKVEMPDGGHVNLWGTTGTMFRSILRPVSSGVGAGNERAAAGDGLWEAIGAGLAAATNWQGTEPIREWVEGRKAIWLGQAESIVKNEDQRGRAITNAEGDDARRWDRLKFILMSTLPAAADVVVDRNAGAIPQFRQPTETSLKEAVGGIFGADYTPPPQIDAAIKDKVSKFLEGQGINPGSDPLGVYRSGNGYPYAARVRFEADNPDIRAYLTDQARQALAQEIKPVGREALARYNNESKVLMGDRDAAIRAAGAEFTRTGDATAYKRAVSAAWDNYTTLKADRAKNILGAATLDEANDRLAATYGKSDRAFAIDRAYDEYEGIRAADDTPEARDAMLEARRAYLRSGGGADKKYGAGMGQQLTQRIRDNYVAIGGETYGQYFDAQQRMGQYATIPTYTGIDTATERRARAILRRADAAVKEKRAPNRLAAVLLDVNANPDDQTAALTIARVGAKIRNPEKKRFLQDNARVIGPFYRDVQFELLDTIAGE